jgi:hypothetical protein
MLALFGPPRGDIEALIDRVCERALAAGGARLTAP